MPRTDSSTPFAIGYALVAERDWEQFHNPENLAMALVAEGRTGRAPVAHAGTGRPPASGDAAEVEHEIADVLIFLVELADRLKIDPLAAAEHKLALNAQKYPVEKARGRATKYDKL
jgi:hypothetical protein